MGSKDDTGNPGPAGRFWMRWDWLDESGLKSQERMVMLAISRYQGDNPHAWASRDTLVRASGLSSGQFGEWLGRLRERGLVETIGRGPGKPFLSRVVESALMALVRDRLMGLGLAHVLERIESKTSGEPEDSGGGTTAPSGAKTSGEPGRRVPGNRMKTSGEPETELQVTPVKQNPPPPYHPSIDPWVAVEEALIRFGVQDPEPAIDGCRSRGCTPAHALNGRINQLRCLINADVDSE